jgi:hypothetical protein
MPPTIYTFSFRALPQAGFRYTAAAQNIRLVIAAAVQYALLNAAAAIALFLFELRRSNGARRISIRAFLQVFV